MKSQEIKNPLKYPKVITTLPKAIVQVKGIKAWVLQGEKHRSITQPARSSIKVTESFKSSCSQLLVQK